MHIAPLANLTASSKILGTIAYQNALKFTYEHL
jgi:hypothetical protein